MRHYGSTIGQALGAENDGFRTRFDASRVAILRSLVQARMAAPETADNIRVFIKREPHKLAKIVEGRYRIISAVSLVDTMCDRIRFGWLMRVALSTVCETPVMIGWAPVNRGYAYLEEVFRGMRVRGLDKTAWDWTVRGWLIEMVREVIKSLAVSAPPEWTDWVDRRWECLFRDARFEFSDGTIVQQPGWGVMKSGCYLTIMINSIGQLLYHALALRSIGKPVDSVPFVTIGDDVTCGDFPEFDEYERYLNTHGTRLKPSTPLEHIEFAGFVTGGGLCWPEYWKKHAYAACHTPAEKLPELLSAYRTLYAMESGFEEWLTRSLSVVSPTDVVSRRTNMRVWTEA